MNVTQRNRDFDRTRPRTGPRDTPACVSIDPATSAVLLMDFQYFVLDNFIARDAAAKTVDAARRLLQIARALDLLTIHVNVVFRPGFPEIDSRNELFRHLSDSGLVTPGSDGVKIHSALRPSEYEPVIAKHRIGAFAGTELERLLRACDVRTLVLAGVTTSGVVLSTVRQAFDLDYELVVASEACTDADAEVHNVLIEKVLPQHARVVTIDELDIAMRHGATLSSASNSGL
jgi:nicotinamidase-related amidase